jgi:Methyltransferase FkbM domain
MLSFGDEFLALYRDKKTTVAVRATTLDEYWRGETRAIDLVKMDAEGSEPMIVDGMRGILAQPHLTVMCELVKLFTYLKCSGLAACGMRDRPSAPSAPPRRRRHRPGTSGHSWAPAPDPGSVLRGDRCVHDVTLYHWATLAGITLLVTRK